MITGELDVRRVIVAKILHHTDRSVTAIYDRPKREAWEAWSAYLTRTISPQGGGGRQPGDGSGIGVMTLRRVRPLLLPMKLVSGSSPKAAPFVFPDTPDAHFHCRFWR
ncbi:MAG: hypothetical protein CMM70_10215 [Rhodospirillaceae bacterium]|nr:hypothetical protein [Rhodospirillaceae bacterium]